MDDVSVPGLALSLLNIAAAGFLIMRLRRFHGAARLFVVAAIAVFAVEALVTLRYALLGDEPTLLVAVDLATIAIIVYAVARAHTIAHEVMVVDDPRLARKRAREQLRAKLLGRKPGPHRHDRIGQP